MTILFNMQIKPLANHPVVYCLEQNRTKKEQKIVPNLKTMLESAKAF